MRCWTWVLGTPALTLALPRANAEHILFLWNGVIVGFLFFWLIGLVTELQRSEVLSVDEMVARTVAEYRAATARVQIARF